MVFRIFRSLRALDSKCTSKPTYFATQLTHARSVMSTANETSEVTFEKTGDVGVIQLNRPKALNALTLNMVRAMNENLKEWQNSGIKLVICKGLGEKAFCAGGDIVAIYQSGRKKEGTLASDFFKEEYTLNHLIGTLPVPYVALIHGITMGGGVGISVHGKYRVATEKTMFAMPETAIGFLTDVGGSYFLPRLKGKLGMYLALTGNRLVGKDVKLAGIATHFVDSNLMPDLQKDLISITRPNSAAVKKTLDAYEAKSVIQKDAEFSLADDLNLIDKIFGEPNVEGILEALKREDSQWSRKLLETLSKMSPSSLKIVYRQIQEGSSKTLAECLSMEYRVSQRLMMGNDFYEGVRAKLVDKDNSPKWQPSKLEDISDAEIDAYFEPFANSGDELRLVNNS